MLYALAVVWWLHCQSDSRGKLKLTPTVGERLAPLTFAVYLLHPQILRLVNNFLPALPTFFGWLLVVLATFLLAYGMRLLTNKALEKASGFLIGPLRLLQRCLGLR
jgi:peptidoglycan/LPS O-acetylase OafA/YrhL